ncbi:MAG: hypothetical protein IKI50_03780 [Clostridia bacterium]|nr:hypothetical protein [Clostridia bacterium]
MLQALAGQQVTDVVLTPHYGSGQESMGDFLARRENALRLLDYKGALHLHPAAEVFLTEYLFNNPSIDPLFFPQTRLLLIELPYHAAFTGPSLQLIQKLQQNYSAVPVLAHAERYPALVSHPSRLRDLVRQGVRIQVNLSTLENRSSLQKCALRWAGEGLLHAVGTDCHNTTTRPPQFERGAQVLTQHLGEGAAASILAAERLYPPPRNQQDDFPYLFFP